MVVAQSVKEIGLDPQSTVKQNLFFLFAPFKAGVIMEKNES